MVDPNIRLQNIAIEAAELQSRRQMCWSEASARATMFLTVLGTTVFGLALFGNATNFDRTFLVIALLLLPILIFTGISSLGRMSELERQDGSLVSGLNRLRHLRVELDPGIEPYLVASPYDDAASLLSAFGDNNPRLHGLFVLEVLLAVIVALAAGLFVTDIALLLNVDGTTAAIAGVVGFFVTMAIFGLIASRSFASAMAEIKPMFPAPSEDEPPQP